MSSHQHHDMYYDNPSSRSPGSHRHPPQTLHRQPSRQFDAYGQLPNSGLYAAEDHAAQNYLPRDNYRLNATLHSNYGGGYEMGAPQQGWNSLGQNNAFAALNATTRMKPLSRPGRAGLPTSWLDQTSQLPPMPPFPPAGFGGSAALSHASLRHDALASDPDEELIPTAIVIKNIPFAVKKEQLVDLMTNMQLPLPYAFNYHFDHGVFRGLAFANFTTAEETAKVIEGLNHFELSGRKLRVEYKKMLPLAERERIEREKRERRGQLEEQHRPLPSQLHNQSSVNSLSSHIPATSPSPLSARDSKPLDFNDPQALQFYTQLVLFQNGDQESMSFPHTLSPADRRTVHTLAHHLGLMHISQGTGDQRQVHVLRSQYHDGQSKKSPPIPPLPTSHPGESHRRALNRAATTDFSDVRASDSFYGTLGRQSSGFLGFGDSAGGLNAAHHNLRAAKSYADLRSYTPSPVPSTASFPATLNTNFSRFADLSQSSAGSNPNLTPTTTSMGNRDESLLLNGLNSMSIGSGLGQSGSPSRLRGAWERETPGPIGGHRTFSTNFDEQNRDRSQGLPTRQPRGPIPERGTGFSRTRQNGHHNRGSDELSSQSGVEIVVEH